MKTCKVCKRQLSCAADHKSCLQRLAEGTGAVVGATVDAAAGAAASVTKAALNPFDALADGAELLVDGADAAFDAAVPCERSSACRRRTWQRPRGSVSRRFPNIENGVKIPRVSTLRRVFEALGYQMALVVEKEP